MNKQDFFEIGSVVKTHGIHGEVILEAKSPDLLKNIKESISLEIDGLLVPFFIAEIKQTSQERYRIKFDWIDSNNQGKKLTNCPAFIHSSEITFDESVIENNFDLLVGFEVTDKKYGLLGIINYITPDENNPLMSITYNSQEILIPLHSDLIKEISQKKKSIVIASPDGLIDLYFD